MELHQLKYFVAVSEERSFSRAAERVRVSQPSLSQQIQKLEAEAGRPLFDRLSRQVTLTEAGQGLLPHAKAILSQLNDAQQFLNDYQEAPAGTVRLGAIPTIAPYLLRPLLRACQEEFPQLLLKFREDVTQNLVRATASGEIDLAVISTCRPDPGMALRTCLEEPLLAVVPERHPLAGQDFVRWPQLRKESMLVLHDSHCLSTQIRRWCNRHHVKIREDLATLQLASLLAMVAAGQGISLVPTMAVRYESGAGCVFLPFRGARPTREINILRNPARYQGKATAALAQLIQETLTSTATHLDECGGGRGLCAGGRAPRHVRPG